MGYEQQATGTEILTLIAENIGGTCHISPQKDAAAFFISLSLMCSQDSLWITCIDKRNNSLNSCTRVNTEGKKKD